MKYALFVTLVVGCAAGPATEAEDAGTPGVDASIDAGTAAAAVVTESEPNGGTPETDVDDWDVATIMEGAIDKAGDADVFKVATVAGKVYRITLEKKSDSAIDGWLTVMDTGRGTKAAGGDYVKLSSDANGPGATLEFLAMGAGHYVIVRDKGGKGGATYGYSLRAEVLETAAFASGSITFPGQLDGVLTSVGALRLYAFDGDEGTDVVFDLKKKSSRSAFDPRLFVFNVGQGDWIARNDNRSAGDDTPKIDAPLTAGGPQFLVVENIEEDATDLAFTVTASKP